MVAENILVPVSGTLVGDNITTHTATLSLMCGVANGSVVIPIAVDSAGKVITTT
jgi:hypothetical protein